MNKILMILTHNRLACLRLCLEHLDKADAFRAFDKVVFLLNAVKGRHLQYVTRFMGAHANVSWDTVEGPGTRPEGIAWMENECVKRYPDSVYVKVDEDIFVPEGWADRLLGAYDDNKGRDNLALITPLIPNHSLGLHKLLTDFYPEFMQEHRRRFGRDPSPERVGFTSCNPYVGEWATRLFIDLEAANRRHRMRLEDRGLGRYCEFSAPFSIGCICYDYRHWHAMGGIPSTDEPGWCQWITDNGHVCVLDLAQIAHHYSFFMQQDWLDRTTLLEDIRIANLPGTLPEQSWLAHRLPCRIRLARQIPRIIQRRLHLGS